MTAIAVDTARTDTVPRPHAAARRIPLSRVTRIELRKMFDTRSGFWLMASIAITATIATGAVILFAPDDSVTYDSFGAAVGVPMTIVLPMIAILSVTSEWSQRSGLTTFTLVPSRGRVILAKALAAVGVAVASMLLALAIGALGNVVGAAINGTPQVWNIGFVDALQIILGNVLGLLAGFMLGVVIRNSPGAIVAYFVYSLVLPSLSGLLATSQEWYRDAQPWVDVNYAQTALYSTDAALTGAQWAHIAVTGVIWLVIPLAVGLRMLMRSEIK
jgi:ABC-type transport system involved in multi-copper enzyme maturation permease subunit